MESRKDIAVWSDYELLDSGNKMKLERFGAFTVARPEPHALWSPATPEAWNRADARFVQHGDDGSWDVRRQPSDDWTVAWEDLRFGLRLSSFKHTGLFPEQAANWAYIRSALSAGKKMLNIFGYTGGATLAGLSVGAHAVHVDASRPAIAAAKRNAELSGLAGNPVRWLEDDAVKFVQRELRRGNRYDLIVMDPPAFGRGPNKEIWRFDEGLLPLLQAVRGIANPGATVMVNAYSMGYPAIVVEQTLKDAFPNAVAESVELTLKETNARGYLLPAGITVRATV